MDFEIRRELFTVAQKFKNSKFDLVTVSEIIEIVRRYKNDITLKEARTLLNIPLSVLINDTKLIDEKTWAKGRADYFSGNIVGDEDELEDEFVYRWRSKFSSSKFDLLDLIEYFKIIIKDFNKQKADSEYFLRNVEVTLRDDLKLNGYSDFKNCGELFYLEIYNLLYHNHD